MKYELLYDVTQQTSDILNIVLFSIFLIFIGIVIFIYNLNKEATKQAFAGVWLVLVILISAFLVFTTMSDHRRYSDIVSQGRCAVVEGLITDFSPAPQDRKPSFEAFTVQGLRFAYTDGEETGAFNRTNAWNGLLHNGLKVRICFASEGPEPRDKRILRLEVDSLAIHKQYAMKIAEGVLSSTLSFGKITPHRRARQ